MSSIKQNLTNLRSKLLNMQNQLNEKQNEKTIKKREIGSIIERVTEIKSKSRIINLNIGGKLYSTKIETLTKDPKSVFALLLNGEFKNKDLPNNELFFDRPFDYFPYLLDYLRFGHINYSRFSPDELKNLYKEAEFYEITDIRDHLSILTKDIQFESVKTSGKYLNNGVVIGTNSLEDLNDPSLLKGICANSPGLIEIKLNSVWEFNKIEIGGYIGDKKLWNPGNGSGAQILSSENGIDFQLVGHINPVFCKKIVEIELNSTVKARFIKFLHPSYLGIGYLKIKKLEE